VPDRCGAYLLAPPERAKDRRGIKSVRPADHFRRPFQCALHVRNVDVEFD
jgi:hypothetical protein